MRKSIADLENEAMRVRRKLHKIPEEGFKEYKTSDFIYNYLKSLNIYTEKTAATGVIAYIPGEGENTIAFRADIDGLSVKEEITLDYSSTHQGMMHACGHDGHMTILLLFAKYLVEDNIRLKDNVLLIFQPAEEGPGGAKVIIREGVLSKYKVKKIYSCHIMPTLKEGIIATRPGGMMAKNGEFFISILGKSGHAASPHISQDAIMISANLINALNQVISKDIDPIERALFSIGTINGGTRVNVIADEVILGGTMRAFNEDTFDALKNSVLAITKGFEITYNCKIHVKIHEMYPPVWNDYQLYKKFKSILDGFLYEEALPMMIAEDFSYYQREVPGLFFYIGSRNEEKDFRYDLHHNKFNFDEKILLNAVEIYARLLEQSE